LAILLVTSTVAFAPTGASHESDPRVDVSDRVDGDVYVLSITVDEEVKLSENSELTVKASYTGRSVDGGGSYVSSQSPTVVASPDVTFDDYASRQHGSALAGFFEGATRSLEDAAEETDAEFDRGFAASVNDLNDLQVVTREPVSATVDQGPNEGALNGMEVTIDYNDNFTLPGPADGAASVTYHLYVTVPGAQWISVDGHLHLPASVQTSAIGHEGGFELVNEDFAYDQRVETSQASAARQGTATYTFEPSKDEYLYAHMGPSNLGTTITSARVGSSQYLYGATTPNVAFGDYRIQFPDGSVDEVPECLGAAGFGVQCPQFSLSASNGPDVIGSQLAGTYEFVVDRQAGANAEDLFVTGFEGPLEP
jgi:hypothetical protein